MPHQLLVREAIGNDWIGQSDAVIRVAKIMSAEEAMHAYRHYEPKRNIDGSKLTGDQKQRMGRTLFAQDYVKKLIKGHSVEVRGSGNTLTLKFLPVKERETKSDYGITTEAVREYLRSDYEWHTLSEIADAVGHKANVPELVTWLQKRNKLPINSEVDSAFERKAVETHIAVQELYNLRRQGWLTEEFDSTGSYRCRANRVKGPSTRKAQRPKKVSLTGF